MNNKYDIETQLKTLINNELYLANLKYPNFSSLHEAKSITEEEVEELKEEIEKLNLIMKEYWTLCRRSKITTKEDLYILLDGLDQIVINTFKELIQVGAMSKKARGLL